MGFISRPTLAQKEQRLAYKLLIPAFLVLSLIALYPLAYVFYASITNKKFASDEKVRIVGFDNYKSLLSFSLRKITLADQDFDEIRKSAAGQIKQKQTFAEMVGQKWTEDKKALETAILINDKIRFAVQKKVEDIWASYAEGFRKKYGHPSGVEYKVWEMLRIGDSWYIIGAGNPAFLNSILNTLLFAFFSVLLETILGLAIALVVNSKFIGKGVMRGVMLVPWAIITIVSAKIWEWMLMPNRTGLFNTVMSYFGAGEGHISFLTNPSAAMSAMIAIDVWKTTPFMALLLLAGLQTIPETLYEAAEVDGASKVNQFFKITLPLLKPTIAVALVFRTLDSLRVFDLFQVLLGDRIYSMASYNYALLISFRDMGMASAVGVLIFIILYGFAFSYMKILGVNNNE